MFDFDAYVKPGSGRLSSKNLDTVLKETVRFVMQDIHDRASLLAPVGEGPTAGTLQSAIETGHIVKVGQNYEGSVTVNTSVAPHAIWVVSGTGIYGRYRRPYTTKFAKSVRQHRKRPDNRANRMTFKYDGRVWFLFSVKGQKPNPFLAIAYEQAQVRAVPVAFEFLKRDIIAVVRSKVSLVKFRTF